MVSKYSRLRAGIVKTYDKEQRDKETFNRTIKAVSKQAAIK